MTVSSITPVNNYTGNSSATKFDFDFLIEQQEELVVTHIDKDGKTTILQFGIDYSINEIGNKNGSYITFPLTTSSFDILSSDEIISLSLSLNIKQESEFENSSNLNLSILEKTFDYIVRILQILNRKIERSVKITEGLNLTPDSMLSQINDNVKLAESSALEVQQILQQINSIFSECKGLLVQMEEEGKKLVQNVKDVGFYMQEGKLHYYDEEGELTEYKISEEELTLKANTTFDNVSPAQSYINTNMNWIMPDYSRTTSIELKASEEVLFVVPCPGVILGNFNYSTVTRGVKVNDIVVLQANVATGTASKYFFIYVSTGDVVKINTYSLASNVYTSFAPLKGVES